MSHSVSFRRHVLRIKARDDLSFAQVAARFSVGVAARETLVEAG